MNSCGKASAISLSSPTIRAAVADRRRAAVRGVIPTLRGSTVTSNLPFEERTSVFGAERLTGALLDRLTHHVHTLEMNGDSYRLAHPNATHAGILKIEAPRHEGPDIGAFVLTPR